MMYIENPVGTRKFIRKSSILKLARGMGWRLERVHILQLNECDLVELKTTVPLLFVHYNEGGVYDTLY